MTKVLKIGTKFYYIKDPKSGFWINQFPTEANSAALTGYELSVILNDKLNKIESMIKELRDVVKDLEND